jgi:hypothetical protein
LATQIEKKTHPQFQYHFHPKWQQPTQWFRPSAYSFLLFPDQKQHKGHFPNQCWDHNLQLVRQEEGGNIFGNTVYIISISDLAIDNGSGCSCWCSRTLSTGLSIGAAGLFGDDMVVAKMNFVVGLTMSQNWDRPSDVTASW